MVSTRGAGGIPALPAAWKVVAGAFIVLMTGFGALYSYAAFAEDFVVAFAADRSAVAVIYALSGGGCFLVSALSGFLSDRLGPHRLAALGMVVLGAGLMTTAGAERLAEVYLGFGLMTGIGVGLAYVPALVAVQRCFSLHRGLACGIAVSGIGLGTALIPAMAALLARLGDWRVAFLVCGCLVIVVGGVGSMLLAAAGAGEVDARRDMADRVVLRRDVALAYAGVALVGVPAVLPHAMLVATALDLGLARPAALVLLGLIGVGTMLGRVVVAGLADRFGRRRLFLISCGGMSASMLIWVAAPNESALRVFAIAFGALQGAFVALLPAFVADSFGLRRLGGVMGALYTARGLALLAAPPLLVAMGQHAGYGMPLVAVAMLGLVGVLSLAAVRTVIDRPVVTARTAL